MPPLVPTLPGVFTGAKSRSLGPPPPPKAKSAPARTIPAVRAPLNPQTAKGITEVAPVNLRARAQIPGLPRQSAQPKPSGGGHSLFSLHTLESAGGDIAHAIGSGAKAVAGAAATAYNDAYGVAKGTRGGAEAGRAAPGAAMATPINAGRFAASMGTAAENVPGSALRNITGGVPGIVDTGKAAVQAVEGKPGALLDIGKGVGELALHPLKTLEHEPVTAGLMALGGEAGAGTAAGDIARSGALGERAAAAADTARPALQLYNDLSIPREYSPDVIRKAGQVAADKFREKVLNDPNVNQATGTRLNRHIYGGGLLGQSLERGGVPLIGQQGFFKPGLVDKTEAASKNIRRMYTTAAYGFMEYIKPKGMEDAVPLAVEGTIRAAETAKADLEKRLAGLQEQAQRLTGNEARLNKAQQDQITGLLANKRFLADPQPAIDAAREFADHQQPLTDRKIQLGAMEPDQMHAKMVPYATQHMGAEYNLDPGKHPLVAAIRTLQRRENAAARAGDTQLLADVRGALLKAKNDLAGMKDSGLIKPDGSLYPRLELEGKPLTYDQIDAHAKANMGDREIGFLTHKETSWGQATHSHSSVRPAILKQTRTGVAYRTGAYDSSWDALKRQAYKDANEIAGHEGRDEIVRRFGIGSYHSKEDAATAADNFNHTPDGERITRALGPVVPVHAGPDRVLNRALMPSSVASKTLQDFGLTEHKAISELGPEGKFRLMPKAVVDRLKEHDTLNNSSKATRALQAFTNKWRSTALFTTPRWPVGTTQENMIRLAFASINPFAAFGFGPAAKLGSDVVDHFRAIASDPAATEAERFAARTQVSAIDAGTQYGGYVYNSVHRPHADVLPAEAKIGMDAFTSSKPISQMLTGWNMWKGFVGHGLRSMETNTKKAMLGKAALSETKRFTGEWKALMSRQDRAVRQYAEGKLTPSTSAKLGDDIMNMAGNWTTLTPAVRRATQTWSPFGLWWLNSMKFVFQTLPKDHPFKTAALAAMIAGTGASKDEASKPEYLHGGVGLNLPIVGHVTMTPLHYSPFGIGVEPLTTAAGMVVPQLSDAALTAVGVNPLSYQSETPEGSAPLSPGLRLGRALETFPEGLIPGVRAAEAIAREGGKQNNASLNPIAVKPGTKTGLIPAIAKAFAPFPFTAERGGGRKLREIHPREVRALREIHPRELPTVPER